MVFIYHVILPQDIIKTLNDFMVSSAWKYVTNLPSLVAIGSLVAEIK